MLMYRNRDRNRNYSDTVLGTLGQNLAINIIIGIFSSNIDNWWAQCTRLPPPPPHTHKVHIYHPDCQQIEALEAPSCFASQRSLPGEVDSCIKVCIFEHGAVAFPTGRFWHSTTRPVSTLSHAWVNCCSTWHEILTGGCGWRRTGAMPAGWWVAHWRLGCWGPT